LIVKIRKDGGRKKGVKNISSMWITRETCGWDVGGDREHGAYSALKTIVRDTRTYDLIQGPRM
jgi:hypothetical protein